MRDAGQYLIIFQRAFLNMWYLFDNCFPKLTEIVKQWKLSEIKKIKDAHWFVLLAFHNEVLYKYECVHHLNVSSL